MLERAQLWLGAVALTARALGRCFFSLLAPVVIIAFFVFPPQGKELLALVVEDAAWSTFWPVSLIASATAVAAIVWYTSRVSLDFRDFIDAQRASEELKQFADRLATWLPRVLGALCILPLAFFLADVGVKTYVLDSPLLIVAAFALFAAIDSHQGCLRCRLYRWGFITSLAFVLLAHRWTTEVPYGDAFTASALIDALFRVDGSLSLTTTGFQLIVGVLSAAVLDVLCRIASRGEGGRLGAESRRRGFAVAVIVTCAAIAVWLATFGPEMMPRAPIVVPVALIAAISIVSFFVHRRAWFPKIAGGPTLSRVPRPAGDEGARATPFAEVLIAPLTKLLLWAAFGLGALVLLLVCLKPIAVGRFLGAPALLVLALGVWVVFGGIVLGIVPKAYGLPSLGLLPLIVGGCNALGDSPVSISRTGEVQKIVQSAGARPDIGAAFTAWRKGRADLATGPIYLVAAAGGGIRAAFLTASYLAASDDLTDGRFGSRVFAISGVSGGSLGAAAYVVLTRANENAKCTEADRQSAAIGPRQRRVICALDEDFLSPVAATWLFPDLLRAFWIPPFVDRRLRWQDRGRTLEQGWQASIDALRPGGFDGSFLDYAKTATAPVEGVPASVNLILNSTGVQSGERVIASTFWWGAAGATDLMSSAFDTRDLSFVGAVHNSARFTYVSPAGSYYYAPPDERKLAGQLADGGYFDNSGVLALTEMLGELRASLDADTVARLRFVIITNDGAERRICDSSNRRDAASVVQLTAPIATFFAARVARAELSKAELRQSLTDLTGRVPCSGDDPVEPLIEVSLNNDLVADFLRDEARGSATASGCDDTPPDSPDPSRKVTNEKEIAVRVTEAPLGWTLSAGTVDWLTRYARRAACDLRKQLPG
jgi:uncharacterized membrane-anchored protein